MSQDWDRRLSSPIEWNQPRGPLLTRSTTPTPASHLNKSLLKASNSASVPSNLCDLVPESNVSDLQREDGSLGGSNQSLAQSPPSPGLSRTQSLGTLSHSEMESQTNEARRDELLEKYYQYQKDRREIRKRNIQAQVNIAQYFRKHQLNLFPSDHERSQMSLREEYHQLLKQIEQLTGQKEEEGQTFRRNTEQINFKKSQLEHEIMALGREMTDFKMAMANATIHATTGKAMSSKEVVDQIKTLTGLEDQMRPLRLEHAKLRRRLDSLEGQWKAMKCDNQHGSHAIELALETSVLRDKIQSYQDEYQRLQNTIDNDIAVLTLTKMKRAQLKANNQAQAQALEVAQERLREVKLQEMKSKKRMRAVTAKEERIRDSIGYLWDEALQNDFFETWTQWQERLDSEK